MKRMKSVAIMLVVVMLVQLFCVSVYAASTVGHTVSVSNTNVKVGDQVEVVVALTGYTEEAATADAIRGLQIDLTNIDPDVLSVVECTSLIEDATAVSNTASYSDVNERVRLAYVQMTGTLPASVEDVFKVVFQVNSTLTESGSITIPVAVKMQTKSQQITQNSECTINYSVDTPTVISVDISWGAMEFVYDDGTWDTTSHKWIGGGWNPASQNSNAITVKNNGSSDVKVAFSYASASGYDSISGTFSNSEGTAISEPISLMQNAEQICYLNLSGTAEERWTTSYTKVGTATITLTE